MPELVVRPDPDLWTPVPDVDRDPVAAAAWLEEQVDRAPASERERVTVAAALALRERSGGEPALVLLLNAPQHGLVGTLSLYVLTGMPVPSDEQAATDLAARILASEWDLHGLAVSWGAISGWRFTALDAPVAESGIAIAEAASTVYVLSHAGHAIVALLPPLRPEQATAAQVVAERVLSTLEIPVVPDVR